MIWLWWSHIIEEEELGDGRLVDIGVGTQGDSGLVTLGNTGVDTPGNTDADITGDTYVHTIGDIGVNVDKLGNVVEFTVVWYISSSLWY